METETPVFDQLEIAQPQPTFAFRVEHAKSDKGRCHERRCRLNIEKGELRYGEPYRPPGCSDDNFHVAHRWYHLECGRKLLKSFPLRDTSQIDGFADLSDEMKGIVDDWFLGKAIPAQPGKQPDDCENERDSNDGSGAIAGASSEPSWRCQNCLREFEGSANRPRLYAVHYVESCGSCPSHKTHLPDTDDERELRSCSRITCDARHCRKAAMDGLKHASTPMDNITDCPKCDKLYALSRVDVKEIARSRGKIRAPFLMAHGIRTVTPPTTPTKKQKKQTARKSKQRGSEKKRRTTAATAKHGQHELPSD